MAPFFGAGGPLQFCLQCCGRGLHRSSGLQKAQAIRMAIKNGPDYFPNSLHFRSSAPPCLRGETGRAYSMITVDCPEISNRFRQRMFLHAIMSSFRTM